jgi:hypothetical protein
MKSLFIFFTSVTLFLPLAASAKVQSLFQEPANPKWYYESVDPSTGTQFEHFLDLKIAKIPKNGIPDGFENWDRQDAFQKRRLSVLKGVALALQGLRMLPIGTLIMAKNHARTFVRRISPNGKVEESENFPESMLPEDPIELKEISRNVRSRLLNIVNRVMWDSREVIADGNVFGASAQFQMGAGGVARETSQMNRFRKFLAETTHYTYNGIALNFCVNFKKGEIFIELTDNSERLKEVKTYVLEAGLTSRFSLFLAQESEEEDILNYTQILSRNGLGTKIADKVGGVFYGLGLGAVVRGPKFLSVGGSPPLIGNLGFPPAGFDWTSVYTTHWKQVSLLRITLLNLKWFDLLIKPLQAALQSCNAALTRNPLAQKK